MVPAFLQSLSPLIGLASYHMIIYGTLLGTELYQSFVMTKVCYNALPMSAFTTLQKRVFPVYFRGQTLLLVLTALTHPPYGPVSLAATLWDLIPLAFGGAMAALNLMVWGPRAQTAMTERIHQSRPSLCPERSWMLIITETKDGKKYNDPEVISDEMKAKNRAFSKAHAMSIHINLMTIAATMWYGFRLSSRFQMVEG